MGLDMRPMGKPKPGFENRYLEIYEMISKDKIPAESSLLGRLFGKKSPTREELLAEWFANQIKTYETIGAPRVGQDPEATAWMTERYEESDKTVSLAEFLKEQEGYYVIELAREQDGVPVYKSMGQDENVFRGQFLNTCKDVLTKSLIEEAWNTKLAAEALDYGNRLMHAADTFAGSRNLQHLKTQHLPPDDAIEKQVHVVYSLARWLIFYGKNGHGYEADF